MLRRLVRIRNLIAATFLYALVTYFIIIKRNNTSDSGDNEDRSYKNYACPSLNMSDADKEARYYMSQSSYFQECDMLNDMELISIEDVFCDRNYEICNKLKFNKSNELDVVYRMRLNMNDLVRNLRSKNYREGDIYCNVERFVRIPNISMELETKTVERFSFDPQNSYELFFKLHGFYQVNIFSNKTGSSKKIYEDYFYIFPYNMTILLAESKHNIKKEKVKYLNDVKNNLNIDGKSNVFMIRLDSISYPQFRRQMPLTYNYLSNKLEKNVMYTTFSSVGENTHPNIIPLYSGIVVDGIESLNISSEFLRLRNQDEGFFDRYPWIFYNYEKENYLTGFQVY